MKPLKPLVFLFSLIFLIGSCSDDDTTPKGQFETGVFVVNEGSFGQANGTISHISFSGTVTQNLFGSINSGRALGDVVQSLAVNGDRGFIVVNNSNKVEVVDINTFESIGTIEGVSLPRYFTVHDGYGYVTEWVDFSSEGRVSKIDLADYSVEGSVTTDFGAEGVIALNDKLYVSNNFTNTVSVIDPSTMTEVDVIEVGASPAGMVVDQSNKLWVICQGNFDADDGALVQIDPSSNEVLKTINLELNAGNTLLSNKAKAALFYYSGNAIYRINISDNEKPSAPFVVNESVTDFYGIGIDPQTDQLYAGETNFVSNARIFVYNMEKEEVGEFEGAIGTNSFVFRR